MIGISRARHHAISTSRSIHPVKLCAVTRVVANYGATAESAAMTADLHHLRHVGVGNPRAVGRDLQQPGDSLRGNAEQEEASTPVHY